MDVAAGPDNPLDGLLHGLLEARGTVRAMLLRVVRDAALADDLTQEALLRATAAAGTLRGDAAPGTWLAAIALNLARDHFRATARTPPMEGLERAEELAADGWEGAGEGGGVEGAVLRAEMSACILDHVARLPDRRREAVLMHHFAGLDHRAIAEALETSEGNARVILHRGLSDLRDGLKRECVLDFNDPVPCERKP